LTITVTVYVPEGIAMATDSRLTGHRKLSDGRVELFTISDNSQKLVLLRNETIGASFCGDAIIEGKTVADFLRLFDINKVETNDSVEAVAEKLKTHLEEYSQYNVSFFLAGFDNDEPFVYDISLQNVYRHNIKNGEIKYGCTWKGELEAINKLFIGNKPTAFNFKIMPLKDALDLAEFVVDVTSKLFVVR
jgi:20S proteasome alpha/beta subunit